MNKSKIVIGLVSLSLLSGSVLAAAAGASSSGNDRTAWFVDPNTPTDVQAAHDAFLQGDFARMAVAIKRALLGHPGDADIRRDLLDLYDKAYALRGDRAVAPDWTLPKGVSFALVAFKKRYTEATGAIEYRFSAYTEADPSTELEQLQVTRYPGEVLVDKQAGIGYTEAGTEEGQSTFFTCESYHSNPNREGLYLITLKLKGQPATEGWFLMSHMTASESPNVTVPATNQELSTATPTFQWDSFVSSSYRSFETRKSSACVYVKPRAADDVWANYNMPPVNSATVGANQPGDEGAASLSPGAYFVEIAGKERYHFGPLALSRDSGTVVSFDVK